MRGEVAVAEPEPGRAATGTHLVEDAEGVARDAPAALAMDAARERVEDGVEVRRDVEPEEVLVVAGVPDDGDPRRVDATDQPAEESRRADAARQEDDA